MGAIVKRGTKQKPRFYAQYRDGNRVRRSRLLRGVVSAEHARLMLGAIERNVMNSKVGIEEPTPEAQARNAITLRELSACFLGDVEGEAGYASPKIKSIDNYRRDARSILKVRIRPTFGARAVASVTSAEVERFRDTLSAPPHDLAAASVVQTLAILSKLYNWGRRAGHIDCQNPVQGVERPRAATSTDYLERVEVARLLAKAEEFAGAAPSATWESRVRATMVAAAIYTGMRKGELFGLRWTDVHLDAGRIDVLHSYTLLPKAGKARHLPLHPELTRILRQWKEQCPATPARVVFPVEAEPGRFRMGVKLDTLGLGDVLVAAECHPPADGKPWHMLRHTFASHAVMSGTSLYEVQRLLGHATPQMTQRYAHLAPDHLAGAVARLDFSQAQPADVASMDAERRRAAQ